LWARARLLGILKRTKGKDDHGGMALERELDLAKATAREAGSAIRDLYARQSAGVYEKADGSLVTDADLAADAIIRDSIRAAFPSDAILTEEGVDDANRLDADRVWIVDPIDGTNQFVARTGEFEVLIALVGESRPLLGVIYQPTADLLLSAAVDHGAFRECNAERQAIRFDPVADGVAPRLITSIWLGAPENLPILQVIARSIGSENVPVSDLGMTPRRFLPQHRAADSLIGLRANLHDTFAWEWDYAAADVIVHEAGGAFTDLSGRKHRYNKQVPRNEGGVVTSVDPATHQRVLDAIASIRPHFSSAAQPR
jgi:3'-phosphoadenosine 5'-phosphosulfate (PAPS) 3'-phosphatase